MTTRKDQHNTQILNCEHHMKMLVTEISHSEVLRLRDLLKASREPGGSEQCRI